MGLPTLCRAPERARCVLTGQSSAEGVCARALHRVKAPPQYYEALVQAAPPQGRASCEMWGDVGRCGEMWGDVGRSRLLEGQLQLLRLRLRRLRRRFDREAVVPQRRRRGEPTHTPHGTEPTLLGSVLRRCGTRASSRPRPSSRRRTRAPPRGQSRSGLWDVSRTRCARATGTGPPRGRWWLAAELALASFAPDLGEEGPIAQERWGRGGGEVGERWGREMAR